MIFRTMILLGLLGTDVPPPSMVSPIPKAEELNTTNFVFSNVRLRNHGDDLRLEGTLCRRPNRSLISASRAEIDRLSPSGEVVSTSYAYLPRLSQREDQRFGSFGATLKTLNNPVERVRVCVAQGHGPCRAPG